MTRIADDVEASIGQAKTLLESGGARLAISQRVQANLAARSLDLEREIRRLRYELGIELVESAPTDVTFAAPDSSLPDVSASSGLVEVAPGDLSPGLLRAAILRDGAVLVRGLIDRAEAAEMALGIERAFGAREAANEGSTEGFFEELATEEPYRVALTERHWVKEGGGLLAADSPRLLFRMLHLFERAGLREMIGGYLGEEATLSAQKSTLRRAMPEISGAWHQDGRFMGDVRSLNVWLALSSCGDDAPGLDMVPKRQNSLVESGTEGTVLDYQVSAQRATEASAGVGFVRPAFGAGDAVLFDDLFLHKTGSDPSMSKPRYSIESWFFGPSAFPETYAPLAF